MLGISSAYPLNEGIFLHYLSGVSPIVGAVVGFIGVETAHGKAGKR